jgi:hypothetical protein
MRKLYTLLLVSATVTGAFAALPAGTNPEGEACVSASAEANADFAFTWDAFSDDPTLTIFPNPVKSYATISFTYENVDKISILNIVGREIKVFVPEPGKDEMKISLVDLQPGVYFLAAYYQGSTLITKKFLKEE